jgi:hypothetical protein
MYTHQEEAESTNVDLVLEHIPKIVFKDENIELVHPITEEKINLMIWSLGPYKAQGPDGFSISFYRNFWDLIKFDLKRMLQYTHRSFKLCGNTNSSLFSLIPKEDNPSSFSIFMPISLCNYSYTTLTKIIVVHLKKILPKIILANRGGFMHDMKITDNIVLV